MGWAMNKVEDQYDNDEVDALGPSLAMPPLYVLRSADRCPECDRAIHVYSLGCSAFLDAEEGTAVGEFHFLRRVASLPDAVLDLLKAKCPSFSMDTGEGGEGPYLMNHCPCGAKLDDDFVAGDVGAAFWPDTPEGYANLKLFRLPAETEIPVECGYTIGGGEYLNHADAEL